MIPASPAEVYQAWLDSILHSEMTGGEAHMSDEVGADVSAWAGYITGRNLELVPGERIVQSWRTTEFDDAFEDSIVTILLQETEEGTLLTLEHSNVPDTHISYEEGGWQSNYFEPMIAYFSELRGRALLEPESEATVAPARDISTESAETAMSAPPTAKTTARASRRRKTSASPQRRAASSARKAKPTAATKRKATARAGKAGKQASRMPAKRVFKKASAKTSAKRSVGKKATRASASRRKAARGRRR